MMSADDIDQKYMRMALAEAQRAFAEDEVPVGAVVVSRGHVIGRAHNQTEALSDVTAHAEMIALTSAANTVGGKYLPDATLYVTVEPCLMCAGAIAWSQVRRVVIGAPDTKRGYAVQCVGSPFHPRTEVVTGVLADECSALMKDFFRRKR